MSDVVPVEETNPETNKCVLCAENSSSKVIKDKGFISVLSLLLSTLDVDVKPNEIKKLDLCKKCFKHTLTFYDMNDACMALEKHGQILGQKLLKKTVEGVQKLVNGGIPILKFQQAVSEEYGSKDIEIEESSLFTMDVQVEGQRSRSRSRTQSVSPVATTENATRRGRKSKRSNSSESRSKSLDQNEDGEDDEEFCPEATVSPSPTKTRPVRSAAKKKIVDISSSEDEEDPDEGNVYSSGDRGPKNKLPAKKKRKTDDDDEDPEVKLDSESESDDDDDDDDEGKSD